MMDQQTLAFATRFRLESRRSATYRKQVRSQ